MNRNLQANRDVCWPLRDHGERVFNDGAVEAGKGFTPDNYRVVTASLFCNYDVSRPKKFFASTSEKHDFWALPAYFSQYDLDSPVLLAALGIIRAVRLFIGSYGLIIPPTLMSIGMIFIVHHKRNQCQRTECTTEPGQDW